jgi:hypothetical protein
LFDNEILSFDFSSDPEPISTEEFKVSPAFPVLLF